MNNLAHSFVKLSQENTGSIPAITVNVMPNWQEVALQLTVTIIALYIIKRKFWDRIKDYFHKQNDVIGDNLNNAIKQNTQAEELLKSNQKVAAQVNETYNQKIAQAVKEGEAIKNSIVEKAQQEVNQYKENQLNAIESHKNKALSEIETHTAKIADEMVAKILHSSDSKNADILINDAIEAIK